MPVNDFGFGGRQSTLQDYLDADRARNEVYAQRNTAPSTAFTGQPGRAQVAAGIPGNALPEFNARELYGHLVSQPNAQGATQQPGVLDWIASLFRSQANAPTPATNIQQVTGRDQVIQSVKNMQNTDVGKGRPDANGVRRYTERLVATGPSSFSVQRGNAGEAPVTLGDVIQNHAQQQAFGLPPADTLFQSKPAPVQAPATVADQPITVIRAGRKTLVTPEVPGQGTTQAPANPYSQYDQVMQQMQQIIGGNYQGNFQQLPALAEMAKVSAARGQATEQATARKAPSVMDMIQADFYKLARQMLDQTLRNPNATPEQKAKAYQEFQAVGANLAGRQRFDPFATMYGAGGQ